MPTRILHVLNGLGTGGIEKYALDLFQHINRDKFVFDFLLRKKVNFYEKMIDNLGGKVYYVSPYPEDKKQNYIDVDNFFREHTEYDIVHIHAPSLEYTAILKSAHKYNINCIVLHSHCSSRNTFKAKIKHYLNRILTTQCATERFACSDKAALWMFGKKEYRFTINGIDTDKFTYCESARYEVRKEFGLDDCFVWGHVGRLCETKNQERLIRLFKEQLISNKNGKLLVIGEGNDRSKLEQLAEELCICEHIVFCGYRSDVERLMSAMDVMVFPSKAEGFPITLIEAQCTGLPCVIADTITKQVELTDKVKYCSLQDCNDKWIECINDKRFLEIANRERYSKIIKERGFDIKDTSKAIEEFYVEQLSSISGR